MGRYQATGPTPPAKVAQVRAAMRAGNWRLALRLAARFQHLGPQRDAILSAHGAYTNPRLYRQLGKDLTDLREAGRKALIERYGDKSGVAANRNRDS